MFSKVVVARLFGACLLVGGCAQIPDVGMGRQALAQGNKEEALWHFQKLAEKGIPEAQVALANMKSLSHDKREQALAARWYREAAPHSERAKTQLGKLLARTQPNGNTSLLEAEKLLKSALATGDNSALPPLMQLYVEHENLWPGSDPHAYIAQAKAQGLPQAYIAEIELYRRRGQYQQHLAEIEKTCRALLDTQPACYAELVAVQRTQNQTQALEVTVAITKKAYADQRIEALSVDRVARTLVDSAYPTPQPQLAKTLLEMIAPTYPAAWLALARLQVQFPFLGDAASLHILLDNAIANGNIDAHLLYGELLTEGKTFPANPAEAQRHLSVAAPHLPKAEYLLGFIYKEGLLGEAEPRKAFPLLLSAARRGSAQADLALARMFSDAKGVRPQWEQAWIFATLAQEQQRPGATELLASVSARLPASRLSTAKAKLLEEKAYRIALPPPLVKTPEEEINIVFSDSNEMTNP